MSDVSRFNVIVKFTKNENRRAFKEFLDDQMIV